MNLFGIDCKERPCRGTALLRAAVAYVAILLKPVVPLCWPGHGDIHSKHRSDCRHKGKVPLINGWQRYGNHLPEVAEVDDWWLRWPWANVGGPTGQIWGIALDIDPRHGGDLELEVRGLVIPDTVTNLTGGGGTHHLFRHPGFHVPNKVGVFPGVDVRGNGGQIVLPPSSHESGRQYYWEVGSRPEETPWAPSPNWLLKVLNERPPSPSSTLDGPVSEGRRNAYLASLAGSMRHRGMGEAPIRAALLVENVSNCTPPLPEGEVEKIASSIVKYTPDDRPRTLGTGGRKLYRLPWEHTAPVRPIEQLLRQDGSG